MDNSFVSPHHGYCNILGNRLGPRCSWKLPCRVSGLRASRFRDSFTQLNLGAETFSASKLI